MAGGLPVGLALEAASGTVGGTPSATGTANFTAILTDANGASVSQGFQVTINLPVQATGKVQAAGRVIVK
jgi:hypothetical protein